ncbi:FAD/NAD(P)-binding protein [bacterium]|nr:FAD/NAD(P)-binding protein [bacterium]
MTPLSPLRIAMVGFGPRALGALESLAAQTHEDGIDLQVHVYDPMRWTGAGPNYNPDQSDVCILNIPARSVDYAPPEFMTSHIKPFLEWSGGRYESEDYPARSDIGRYLHYRFEALKSEVRERIAIEQFKVMITGIRKDNQTWWLFSDDHKLGPYDEVLLAQGQPATASDPQIARWEEHAAKYDLSVLPAYPVNALLDAAEGWREKSVAIRGLGLSTFDVLRMLTKNMGGKFVDGRYQASGREPRRVLPFSLDGKPPVAKPATQALDKQYDFSKTEMSRFEAALKESLSCQPDRALEIICEAIIPIVMRILSEQDATDTEVDVRNWFEIERTDPGSQEDLGPIDGLKVDIEVAYGRKSPSIGYVAGQVWRKVQIKLRSIFNGSNHVVETATAIIGFDEAFKRYSYGPPVSAAEELLALIEDGLVSLCIVADPDINLSDVGWNLSEGNDDMTAHVMIDAVLPNACLETIQDQLILSCMEAGHMQIKADGFGAHTSAQGQLVYASGEGVEGLSMLGRLTLGSVIAADSLTDCFGPTADRWASGVIERHLS